MEGRGDRGLKDEGDVRIGFVDMSVDLRQWIRNGDRCSSTGMYLANWSTASVVVFEFSFFTSKMLRGGEGQCRDNKSYPFVSVDVNLFSRSYLNTDEPW